MNSQDIKTRADISKKEMWDLDPLYSSMDQWEKDFRDVEGRIDIYPSYQGKVASSLETFREVLLFDTETSRIIERVYTWAHLKSDEDKGNQENLALYQRSASLYTRLSEVSSFITPEIQEMDSDLLKKYSQDEALKEYIFSFERIMRYKPHTRSHEVEQLMAMMGEVSGTASQVFSQLDNVDMTFGRMKDEHGTDRELSHGNFSLFLKSSNREIRKNAFFQYYASYEAHKNTIAASLSGSIKKDWFYGRARNFSSCREAAMFGDNIPLSVYDNLLDTVKANLAPLFSYLSVRKKILGVDELHFYDTYVPLVQDVTFELDYDKAVEICLEALTPLGKEYCDTLREGLTGGWVDRYENRGKRSGAYSSGCYDSPPYILLNFENNDINSLYTMIHEAGHSMHTWYSNKNQDYVNHGYTIFVAEVASTFNEMLLSKYLLKKYSDDPAMTAYILNREIDNFRATLYRQAMFAEFEKDVHESVEKNEALTLEHLTSIYHGLLETYFGDTLVLDSQLDLECLRIPHFYSAFYVYKYATGISAAAALAKGVLSGDEEKTARYLSFLTLGGSMYPIDELKTAGVDMSSPEPVKEACDYFSSLVDQFDEAMQKM